MRVTRLYNYERPIAQQSALIANQQRDSKRQPKPFSLDDFALYKPLNSDGIPDGAYGSAMLALVKAGECPPWALFCYKELVQAADPGYTPKFPALIADGAMLLHPKKVEDGYEGFLIATEAAGDRRLLFTGLHGEEARLNVPAIHTKFVAEEGVVLLP